MTSSPTPTRPRTSGISAVSALLVLVRADSRTLREALVAAPNSLRPWRRLPIVAVRPGHPWEDGAPAEVGVLHEVSRTVFGLTAGIDMVLWRADLLERGAARNGNPWVLRDLPDGVATPHVIPTRAEDGSLALALNPTLAVPGHVGQLAVLNLSVALRPGRVIAPDEPLGLAVRRATQRLPVVVAAGNWGRAGRLDTLSPLARVPGCLSVGATTDAAGTILWPKSSVGSPTLDGDPLRASGPTLVAHGVNSFDPEGAVGTSFAAPLVSGLVLSATAFLRGLAEAAQGGLHASPVLERAFVDTGFKDYGRFPDLPLPHLPSIGVRRDVVQAAARVLGAAVTDIRLLVRPWPVQRLLESVARRVPGHDEHSVGAGFVDDSLLQDRLLNFTGRDWAHLLVPDHDPPNAPELDIVLADPDELPTLLSLARATSMPFGYDYTRGRSYGTLVRTDHMQNDPRVTWAPDHFPWPG